MEILSELPRYGMFFFVITLIWMCARRQRRYWRELTTNRLSGSVKAGYTISTIIMGGALGLALVCNTPEMWANFVTVVTLGFMFCLKITFSPAVMAATLGICAVQLFLNQTFPIVEVWATFISIITWRLPEEVRAYYAYLSFVWIVIVALFPSSPTTAVAADTAGGLTDTSGLDGLMDV